MRLKDKIAIVTGAGQTPGDTIGNGRATALLFAREGAHVLLTDRNERSVKETQVLIEKAGGKASVFCMDVSSEQDCIDMVARCVADYGRIDILHNNVGIGSGDSGITSLSEKNWHKIIDVNLKGPFELCKKAYPILKQRGGGSIIHISSIGGLRPESGIGIYSVSKAAIINLTQAMAQDWGKDNIRVNAICPGLIKTKFSEALWRDKKILDRFVKQIPLKRPGVADDVAGLAVFLASDAAAYCSGGAYLVDGGYTTN